MASGQKRKKKIGRPRVKIDLVLAEDLGSIQCTYSECSAVMKIPEGTLKGNEGFKTAFKRGAEEGKQSLRRIQFAHARKSYAMAIFLGKVYLGQKEVNEYENPNIPISVDFKFRIVEK